MTDAFTPALEFRHEVGRYLVSRFVHRFARPLWSARLAPIHPVHLPRPVPPAPGWAEVRVRLAGICGTDLSLLTGTGSLYLEPEATYPFVPGHEVVGEVERGLDLPEHLQPGTRVVVWPPLGCATRGPGPPCPACAGGWEGLCARRGGIFPGPALSIGFSRETGGGWSERFLAHHTQLWPLAPEITDRDAVLLDPAAASLAALLRTQEARLENNLVVGGSTIGLLCMELARVLPLPGSWTLLVKHDAQRRWAEARGHSAVTLHGTEAFQTWLSRRGARSTRVLGYGQVFRGVFDRVLVAAGSRTAFEWSLAAVSPRGILGLISAPHALPRLDPTPLWSRDLTVRGIQEYGPVPMDGGLHHPFGVMLPLLETGALTMRDLVTHTFPLSSYEQAISIALRRSASGAIKVAFEPGLSTS